MLLKGCHTLQPEKKARVNVIKQQRTGVGTMKLIGVSAVAAPRVQRKATRVASKRPASGKRIPVVQAVDPCDSSNDSGLGLEQHHELQLAARSTIRFVDQEPQWANESPDVKRKKMEIKLESDDANDNFTFEETMIQAKRDPMQVQLHLPTPVRPTAVRVVPTPRSTARRTATIAIPRRTAAPTLLASQLLPMPRKPHLQIINQPEQQHRARYQTEGSRGAVKDRTGHNFPSVKLVGHDGPAVLQVFIGSDAGRVVPHMFYQACRVSGKNSTQCSEKKLADGTVVIEIELTPAKGMEALCDCVGILKERNVDVEHRFPDRESGSRQSKKKSTRCRMVFRTTVTNPDGSTETLEITSQPIVCTQPPGVPEISKKSLSSGSCAGGQELFILGKNFLKDTRVVFCSQEIQPLWEVTVYPEKEYLQQSHLVCVVPPYRDLDLSEAVTVRVLVTSSGKTSDPHSFCYTPRQSQVGITEEMQNCVTKVQPGVKQSVTESVNLIRPSAGPILRPIGGAQYLLVQSTQLGGKDSVYLWKPPSSTPDDSKSTGTNKMMPPPAVTSPTLVQSQTTVLPPLRPLPSLILAGSTNQIAKDVGSPVLPLSPTDLKGVDLCMKPIMSAETSAPGLPPASTPPVLPPLCPSETSIATLPIVSSSSDPATLQQYVMNNITLPMATGADLSSTQSPSMATLRRFVSSENTGSPLPSLSVEKFLSGLEHKPEMHATTIKSTGILQSALLNKSTIAGNHLTHTGVDMLDSSITSMLFHPQTTISASLESHTPSISINESLETNSNQDSLGLLNTSATNEQLTSESTPMMNLNVSSSLLSNCLIGNSHNLTTECSRMPSHPIHNSIITSGITNGLGVLTESPSVTSQLHSNTILNGCLTNMLTVNGPKIMQSNDTMVNNTCQAQFSEHNMSQEHVVLHCQPALTTTITTASCKDEATAMICDSMMPDRLESSQISATQNARLDALVSSAMDTSTVVPQTNTQKLEELVNSAADSHLNSPEIFNSHTNFMGVNQSDNSMASHASVNIEIPSQGSSEAIDNLMINTLSNSSLENKLINRNLSPKLERQDNSLLSSNYSTSLEENLSGLGNVSSFVTPMEESTRMHDEELLLNTPIKNMLIGSPVLSSANPLLSSSIAVKNMIRHSTASTNSYSPSTITMENMMLSTQEQLVSPGTVRLDALVNSTLDNHSASSSRLENKVDATCVPMHSIQISPMTCTGQLEQFPVSHFTIAPSNSRDDSNSLLPIADVKLEPIVSVAETVQTANQKREEGMVLRDLTQMSEFDLLSYINPSCFDTV